MMTEQTNVQTYENTYIYFCNGNSLLREVQHFLLVFIQHTSMFQLLMFVLVEGPFL